MTLLPQPTAKPETKPQGAERPVHQQGTVAFLLFFFKPHLFYYLSYPHQRADLGNSLIPQNAAQTRRV